MTKTNQVIVLLTVTSILLLAAGCAPTTPNATEEATAPSAAEEPIELNIWINARDSYIAPSELQLSQDQWYITKAFKRFEEANPGINVKLTVSADALQAHQTFRTAALAGNAPDIANLWAGEFIFQLGDVTQDISPYIPKEDLDQINGWETVSLDFKIGNPIIGYPMPNNQICFFLYNKQIIADSGLDFENNPPRTIEDFMSAMQQIKDAGYLPIAADEGQGYPYNFFYIAAYWWVQQNGLEPILAENRGEANFADDQALLNTLEVYHELWAKGYFNQDAATSADSQNRFFAGEVALFPNGSFGVKDAQDALGVENVGAILPPEISADAVIKNSLIGGPGQSLVVSSNANAEAATKLLSFLNSRDEFLKFSEVQTVMPVRKDISAADLGIEPGTLEAQMFEWAEQYTFWLDNELSGPVVDDFTKLVPLVLTGKMTPEEFAKQLDMDK